MSMMVSFVLSFFPRDVLGEILSLIGSVSGDFLTTFTTELTDYMMLLYLQGVTLNMLFVQSLIPKLII